MHIDDVEMCVVNWFEGSCRFDDLSEAKKEKLQMKIEAWVEAHWNTDEAVA